jgi:hypothetical protein
LAEAIDLLNKSKSLVEIKKCLYKANGFRKIVEKLTNDIKQKDFGVLGKHKKTETTSTKAPTFLDKFLSKTKR